MKIAIITMQGVFNYGSVLQTYASQTYFERKGYEVVIIDYYPKRMRHYGTLKQLYTDALPFHKNRVKCAVIAFVKFWSVNALKKVFLPFMMAFNKTRKYESNEDLRNDPPAADIYCTGSDQVWNNYLEEDGFDPAYFLDFAHQDKPRIAFSASFGRGDITQEELNEVQPLLEQYAAIAVRESSGLRILENTHVGIKQNVLDPTFLLTRKEWLAFSKPIEEVGYILVYKLHEDSIASEVAGEIAGRDNKKVIRISTDYFKRIKNGKTVVAPDIRSFVSYVANADLVVTDSFHATSFSIMLNVQFISIQWKMFNDRIDTILTKTKLKERSVSTIEEALVIYGKSIDYDQVNACLEHERTITEAFISDAETAIL